ncbi:hypothetical protein [Mycobacterium intracellulare]|uniref:hypothetical protein n=1 Tax=Mycobacterium intracellulare TaxID=1767 RepID=UPI000B0E772A|nr:hypothetical protein [Mycobacterium intracellulare]
MQSAPPVVGGAGCPAGMGLMMWMMRHVHGSNHQTAEAASQQLDELRPEIELLKAERAT